MAAVTLDERIPEVVRPLLRHYLGELARQLPGFVTGLYVHGSIAYGAFDAAMSDIDCLALVAREAGAADLAALRAIHTDARARWPQLRLEVGYVNWADCGRVSPPAPPHPFHRAGQFHDSGTFDFNSPLWSAVVWWQVRTAGIRVLGPPVEALDIPVTRAALLAASRNMVEADWYPWSRSMRLLLDLLRDDRVDWVTFGLLRTYYTLREGTVASKPAAAEYGLRELPRRWHPLIADALASRRAPRRRGLLRRLTRALGTRRFIRYMVGECRRAGLRQPAS